MTSFSNNKPINEGPNVEKIGQKMESGRKLVKIVDEVVSQKLRASDNARKASQAEFRVRMEKYEAQIRQLKRRIADKDKNVKPTRKALYTTVIIVVISFLLLTLLGNTMAGKEHDILLEILSNEMTETSSRISEMEKSLAQALRKQQTTECNKVSLEDAKIKIRNGGLFDIYHDLRTIQVFCDLETDGGGWIVFQRRIDGSEDFYRGWEDYVYGFGNEANEFWLGLENLYKITNNGRYEMRIDLEDWDGQKRYAVYSFFRIGSADTKYRITLAGYSGDAGNEMEGQCGMKFTTKDQDNDTYQFNCAHIFKGAWWYASCHGGNLNGQYLKGNHKSYADGVDWSAWRGNHYSLKSTEMKIRQIA